MANDLAAQWGENGEDAPPELDAIVRWYSTPPSLREPKTVAELGEVLELSRATIQRWRNHPIFMRKAMSIRADIYGPTELQMSMLADRLYEDGMAGDIKAARTWSELHGYLGVVQRTAEDPIEVRKAYRALTDEELEAQVALTEAETQKAVDRLEAKEARHAERQASKALEVYRVPDEWSE